MDNLSGAKKSWITVFFIFLWLLGLVIFQQLLALTRGEVILDFFIMIAALAYVVSFVVMIEKIQNLVEYTIRGKNDKN